jgi:Mg2+-importing ATPase
VDTTKPLSYYANQSPAAVLNELQATTQGLSQEEAEKRLKKFGRNILSEEKKLGILLEFIAGFKNPLILILLTASFFSFVLGERADGAIIAGIVIMSAVLNFFQEYRANKAAQKLKERVATQATVIRNGEKQEIHIDHLTVGDSIFLSSGDLVPADARLLTSKDFFVNQSSLTGESFPVEKTEQAVVTPDVALNELTNIIFFGTSVVSGSATAIVIKTGKNTEFGKIAQKITAAPTDTEFTKGVKNFSYLILRTTIFFVLFIFFFNTFFKHTPLFSSFTFAIAIAVGLTPELLPMIMSVTMARGSVKMAKKGAIVKKLTAIPNFGSMDILCTDKTGTLTQDKIELVKYTDVFGNHSEKVLLHAYLNSTYQTGIRNPMDEAIINFKKVENHGYEKVDEIPFDFVRKKMSVVVAKAGKCFLITKGAPEEIFKSAAYYLENNQQRKLDQKTKEKITQTYHNFSNDGYRVLAIALKEIGNHRERYTKEDETEMELLGFVAFLDPAKQGVKDVLQQLESMGIEIKVITGDNELVTKKICADVGLDVKGVLLGQQIDTMTDEALRVVAEKTTIFARFSPDDKNRIILALKANNHVVGYVGDGINDASSLKAADVGISVNNAVDVAKESAAIIMTNKSLKELADGVLEGRKTFANTMKYIMMGISSNFGNMFSVLGAVIFIPFLPMLPIQILLNNFLYDVSQVTIPTDNVDTEYIRSPKRWDAPFIRSFMLIFGTLSSLFDFLTFFLLYNVFKATPALFQTGWFIESLATQTFVIYIIRTRKIPFIESMPSSYLLLTTLLAVITAAILPYTFVGSFFSFEPLPLHILTSLVLVIIAYLFVIELGKRIFYKFYTT